jgi:EmrB/QacA subfamily drug resistance transporter
MTSRVQNDGSRMTAAQVWTLAVVCSAVALVIAAAAALNTALPTIAVDTGANQNELTWIVDSYTLCLAALLLPSGALGDRYGRRSVLLAGLAVVAVASALPIWFDDPQQLITLRALAGVGAALVMPSTLSLVSATFPPGQRARGVAIWSGVAACGGITGLLVSGFLLEHWSWRSIFVGFAVASVLLFVVAWTVPASRESEPPPFDIPGALLAVIGIGLLVLGMLEAPIRGWTDPLSLGAIVAGLACAGAFVVVELRRTEPLLDVRLFRNRAFGAGATSLAFQFFAAFSMFFLVIQYMQLVLGFSPLQAGLAMVPMFLPVLVATVAMPWLQPRVGLRWLSAVGLVLCGAGLLVLATLGAEDGFASATISLLIFSAGIGLCTAPATTAILENTPDDKQGVASAVNDTTREVGAAIGIALAGSLLAATYRDSIAPAVAAVPEPAKEPVESSLAAALEVAKAAGTQGDELADFARAAFMDGLSHASVTLGAVLLVAAVGIAAYAPSRNAAARKAEPELVADRD